MPTLREQMKSTTVDHEAGTIVIVFKEHPLTELIITPISYPENSEDGNFHCKMNVNSKGPSSYGIVSKHVERYGEALASYAHYVARATLYTPIPT